MVRCKLFSLFICLALLTTAALAWKSQAWQLSFEEPHGWKAVPQEGNSVSFLGPPMVGLRPIISVSIEPCEDGKLSKEHIDEACSHITNELDPVKILGSREVTVNGKTMHRIGYRTQHQGHSFRSTQVLAVHGQKMYVFALVTDTAHHDKLLPVFEKMLKTVKFID
ncbi:MAG: DcrB-related protein [bacterium]|nr:DcrB-related protein [bacterium]